MFGRNKKEKDAQNASNSQNCGAKTNSTKSVSNSRTSNASNCGAKNNTRNTTRNCN